MARTKGMLNLSGNLEVNAGAPLDARTVVPTVADLTVASNFQYKYVGMPVVVQATGDMYILTANDVTVAANWKQVGSGGGGSSYTAGDGIVIDNDEISTDNMPAADMSEIVTPLPSVMSRLPRYSTEEQIVAYWIDGKPIYQKTIEMSFSTTKWSQTTINYDTTNIEKWISAQIHSNSTYGTAAYVPIFTNSSTSIKIMGLETDSYNYITLRYTKVTD